MPGQTTKSVSFNAGSKRERPPNQDQAVAGRGVTTRRATERGDEVTVREIVEVHPQPSSLDREVLLQCVETCFDCAATCVSCADACLGEKDLQELVRCIRLNLDCADACEAAGRIVTRQTAPDLFVIGSTIEACAVACRVCREECERHAAHHEHCRLCAEICRRCEQACDDLLATIG